METVTGVEKGKEVGLRRNIVNVVKNFVPINSPKEVFDAFMNNISVYAKATGESIKYIFKVYEYASLLGVSDITSAVSLFYNIQEVPYLKTYVGHSIIFNKGYIYEPLEIIKNAEFVYYYVNKQLNEIYKSYIESALKDPKNIKTFEEFGRSITMANLIEEPPKNEGNIGSEYFKTAIRIPICKSKSGEIIYERITEVIGKRKLKDGRIITRVGVFKLSTALKLGILLDKEGEIKKYWNNPYAMMKYHAYRDCYTNLAVSPEVLGLFGDSLTNEEYLNRTFEDANYEEVE